MSTWMGRLRSVVDAVQHGRDLVTTLYGRRGTVDRYFETLTLTFMASGYTIMPRLRDQIAADPERAPVMRRRDDLLSVLEDHDALAALPPDTYGYAYAQHIERAGLFGLREFVEKVGWYTSAARYEWDDELQWVGLRILLEHDLWHVLTGYDASLAGEQYINAWSVHHLDPRLSPLINVLCAAHPQLPTSRSTWAREMWAAWRRGRRGKPTLGADHAALLDRPLAEVQARFEIPPLEEAHPNGLIAFDYDAFFPAAA